jgi:hypothetical protein
MAVSLQEVLDQYGVVGRIANAIPELRAKLQQAAAAEWPIDRFNLEVQNTTWWRTHSDTAREFIQLSITDPKTYDTRVQNAAEKIALIAYELGLQPLGGSVGRNLALQALTSGWDDQQIRTQLAGKYQPRLVNGVHTGQYADTEAQLHALATNYGVPFTDAFLSKQVNDIQRGFNSVDGFEALARARAKSAYPQFAEQLDAGLTLRDIADPYISTMANTLELAETDIDLTEPWIKKALTQKNPDGTAGAVPLWQFERQLKDDPRWDKTKQARDDAFQTVRQLGKDFGVTS